MRDSSVLGGTPSASAAGSVGGVGTFASLLGWIAITPGASRAGAQAALPGLCSVVAVAVGGFWMLSK
jgi:hypothetical protein